MEHSKQPQPQSKRLYRSDSNKVIAGVAGGLSEYFDIDPVIIRIIFVLLTVFQGSGLILYVILWLILPTKSAQETTPNRTLNANVEEMKTKAHEVADEIKQRVKSNRPNNSVPLILIVIGAFFLLNNLGILGGFDLHQWWPAVLIILGLAILMRQ